MWQLVWLLDVSCLYPLGWHSPAAPCLSALPPPAVLNIPLQKLPYKNLKKALPLLGKNLFTFPSNILQFNYLFYLEFVFASGVDGNLFSEWVADSQRSFTISKCKVYHLLSSHIVLMLHWCVSMKSSLLLSKLQTQITEPYRSMAPLYLMKQKKSTKSKYVCLCVCIFVKYTERNFEGSHTNQWHLRRVMGLFPLKFPVEEFCFNQIWI